MSGGNGGVVRRESLSDTSYTGVNSITYGILNSSEEESSIEAASANAFIEKDPVHEKDNISICLSKKIQLPYLIFQSPKLM